MSKALLRTELSAGGATKQAAPRPRVLIVGGGFGGVSAARALGDTDMDVLVLNRTNYHGFWMMLYQVAAAQLEAETIATPVRKLLRRYHNVRFQVAEVRGVDLEHKLVLAGEEAIPYDYLILAAGSATNYFGNDRYSASTLSIHDVAEAERLRDHVLLAFERASREPDPARRAELMTVAVIGGGPTGVELAGAFAELIRGALRKDYPALDMRAARVVLIDVGDTLLAAFPASLRRSARRKLERLGVELRLGAAVTNIEAGSIALADGSTLAAGTVVWAAGVRAAPLADALGVALGRGARVKVAPTLQVPEHPEVFAVGDMAYLEDEQGQPYPMVAQVAIQQGRRAGRNIRELARGRQPRAFHYFDKGQMAMVGRGAALFDSFGVRLAGAIGWLIWLAVHLYYLPGIRNRLAAFSNWLYTLLTGEPGVRVATHTAEPSYANRLGAAPPRPALVPMPVRALPHQRAAFRSRKRARAA